MLPWDPPSTTTTTGLAQQATALLAPGDSGSGVLALQRRLSALGYWLGTPDGTFGDSTEQAVYALQKAAGISRDGIVGPDTSVALAQGVVPHPRSTSGYVVEVDLTDDLLMIVDNGRLTAVLNTSTSGGYSYVEDRTRAIATSRSSSKVASPYMETPACRPTLPHTAACA
jgi:peptidoglycan hydrolase-like protein with peptidoglycan-binding domain